jgi:PEP-CTERM motif
MKRLVPGSMLFDANRWIVVAALTLGAGSASAAVLPDSYSMPNGFGVPFGIYDYWDEIYNGSGCVTCNGALLSGGTGDLTDGIIATQNWRGAEQPAGNGPYVGWSLLDPTITFHWNAPVAITNATFYFDDSNGDGGVYPPASVIIDGTAFAVADPAGSAPFAFNAPFSFTGTDLVVTINRRTQWVFLSEVQFDAVSLVPEPQTYALLLAGLGLLGFAARRRT